MNAADDSSDRPVTDEEYRRLFAFRYALRQFLAWSREQAAEVGLTPQQHQLLLAIRADDGDAGPSIGDVADSLLIRHHSAVELVARVEVLGLVSRSSDDNDQRVVRLALTVRGRGLLEQITKASLEELQRASDALSVSQHFLARAASG